MARYLRARGLSGQVPAALRLLPHQDYYQDETRPTGSASVRRPRPVKVGVFDTMVARVQTLDGRLVALLGE